MSTNGAASNMRTFLPGAGLLRLMAPAWADVRNQVWFSARTLAAVVLALGLAFTFQLSSPMSAATTVLIVANPLVGALVSKSVWRLAATILGAGVTVLMMALFAQSPVLFMLVLSVLIGIACCVSTLLRFFKAYAAVLTGYTIVLVSIPAFSHPENVFLSALSRLSVVTVGIVSTAFVFLVTSVSRPAHVLARIEGAVRMVAGLFGHEDAFFTDRAIDEQEPDRVQVFRDVPTVYYTERSRILAAAGSLVESVEYASADSFEVSRKARRLRLGIARILAMVGAHHPVWQALSTKDSAAQEARTITRAIMREISDTPDTMTDPAQGMALCRRIDHALGAFAGLIERTSDLYAIAIIDSERQVLEQMRAAIANLAGEGQVSARLRLYFEWPSALRNGFRGAFITFLSCMVWYIFSWESGPMMLAYLVPASCLLAASPSASRASVMFASGTALAIPAAFAMQMWVLPRIDGFPLLAFWLVVFLLPGVWVQFHPRYALRGFGYVVFLNAMIEVHNPSHYDDYSLFNTWLAYAVALVGLVLVFRVVLPADQRRVGGQLVQSLVASIERLASGFWRHREEAVVWENLQMQKIQRMLQRLSFVTPPARMSEIADAAFVALSVGRAMLRLEQVARAAVLPAAARAELTAVFALMQRLRRDPVSVAERAHVAAEALLSLSREAEPVMRAQLARAGACLLQVSFLVSSAPGFFDRRGPLQRDGRDAGSEAPLSRPVGLYGQVTQGGVS